MLTDLKHLFALNPLEPVYRASAASPSRAARALEWLHVRRGVREIGDAGARLRLRQRAAAPSRARARVPLRVAPGHRRRVRRRSSPIAAISVPSSGSPTAGRRRSAKAGRRRSTGATTAATAIADDFTVFTLGGRRALDRRGRAGRSTSASTKPTPTRAGPARACRRRPSGRSARSHGGAHRSCSASAGSGRRAPIALSRISSARRRARRVQRQVHVQPARAARLLAARRRPHARAHLPQLLPAARALAIHGHSARPGLMRNDMPQALAVTTEDRLTLVEADGARALRFRRRRARRADRAEEAAVLPLPLRRRRLGAVRGDLRAARVLPDARGAGDPRRARRRDPRQLSRAARRWSSSARARRQRRARSSRRRWRGSRRLRYLPIDISRSMLERELARAARRLRGRRDHGDRRRVSRRAALARAAATSRSWSCGSAATSATSGAARRRAFCAACARR